LVLKANAALALAMIVSTSLLLVGHAHISLWMGCVP